MYSSALIRYFVAILKLSNQKEFFDFLQNKEYNNMQVQLLMASEFVFYLTAQLDLDN